ncbi:MAG: glucose-6-phosphate dehydrogenase [Rikenellaceae bacterium]
MKSLIMIIFGASGDLTKRKLMPALYRLFKERRVPVSFSILGVGRTKFEDESYRVHLKKYLAEFVDVKEWDNNLVEKFIRSVHYLSMDQSKKEEYLILRDRLEKLDDGTGNYLFYLATPPALYENIPLFLKSAGLHKGEIEDDNHKGVRRIVVEKPFGYDMESALRMNSIFKSVFSEKQIFRIDHFLGKETVQNILALRFANGIFEPLWNRNYIDRVEITAVENFGIENRGGFYDSTGALRDMVQNHLIQLLALVAMEPPVAFNEREFRDEIVKVYRSLKPLNISDISKNVIRGQYIGVTKGADQSEKEVVKINGYREEENVSADSYTETFLAMKLYLANWRWEGVPFYIRTGKQMPTKVSEIIIHFKSTPHRLFSSRERCPEQNQLIIRIQPNEGCVLKFDMKVPGRGFDVKQVPMDFTYDKLGGLPIEDAYSKLIEDCMNGESTLFTRSDAVETSWQFFDPILKYWRENQSVPLYGYPAGTWGPLESETIIEGGKKWTNPCKNLINTDLYCEL